MNLTRSQWTILTIFWVVFDFSLSHAWSNNESKTPPSNSVIQSVQRQVLVRLKNEKDLEKFSKKIPNHFKVIDSVGTLVILKKTSSEVEPSDIEVLKNIPETKSVKKDSVVFPQREGDCPDCALGLENRASGTLSAPQNLKQIQSLLPPQSCQFNASCGNPPQILQLWGQKRVDGDLMQKQVEQIQKALVQSGKNPPKTRICVLDSGFDLKKRRNEFASPDLEVRSCSSLPSQISSYGDPTLDETGHGTSIASLIGGKEGVGIAPNLSLAVYRITTSGAQYYSSDSAMHACIERASRQNCDVINLSWGGEAEEQGILKKNTPQSRTEGISTNEDLLETLGSNGTLLVNASGNSGYRVKQRENDLDDPVIRVAAANESGATTDFSTDGEVAAPGEKIYTITSSSDSERLACHSKDPSGSLKRGTSYAAPIVAAIAGQVVWVLKTHPGYRNLSSQDKIALTNRILKASEQGGTVNGLRAVLIAKNWTTSDSTPSLQSVAQLKALMQTPPLAECSQPAPVCENADRVNCQAYQECHDQNRLRLSACLPPSLQAIENLIRMNGDQPYLSEASAYFYNLRDPRSRPSSTALHIWNRLKKKSGRFDPSSAQQVFRDVLRLTPATPEGQLETIKNIREILSASKNLLEFNAEKNRDDVIDLIAQQLGDAVSLRGPSVVGQAISEWIDDEKRFTESGNFSPAAAKLLEGLMSRDDLRRLHPYLQISDRKLYQIYSKNKMTPVPMFSSVTDSLMKRQHERIQFDVDQALRSGSLRHLGSIQVEYAIRNPFNRLTRAQQKILSEKILAQIEKNQGWPGTNLQISSSIMSKHVHEKNWSELEKIASSTQSPHIAAAILRLSPNELASAPESFREKSDQLARRFSLVLHQQPLRSIYEFGSFRPENILPLFESLARQNQKSKTSPNEKPTVFAVPQLDRQGTVAYAPPPISNKQETDPGAQASMDLLATTLMDRTLALSTDLNRQEALLHSIIELSKSKNLVSALKNLPPNSKWKSSALELQKYVKKSLSHHKQLVYALDQLTQ